MLRKCFNVFVLLILVSQVSFSQQMPIDFSDNSDVFSVWGGSTFTTRTSPTDSGNIVGEFVRSNSSSEQGQYIDLIRSIDLDSHDTITLLFYAFDPISHTIIIKLENGTNPNIELAVTASSFNRWTALTFDFSTIGGSGKYDRLVFRFDDGISVSGGFLIDDIHDGSTPTDPNALDVVYTDLVWSDEFDSTTPAAIDGSKWYHQTIGPNGGQWFNNELQHYTDRLDNSFVENGFLNIVAKRENYTHGGKTLQFTSARLNSKFAFTYGRVDVRAKLPSGNGTWPAIWTLGKNVSEVGAYWQTQGFGNTGWPWCGEIDIMEHGLGAVNHTSSALHTGCDGCSGDTKNKASQLISDVSANFHVYSVNWSPNQITFLVDDVAYYTYNPAIRDIGTWPFDLEQFLLLNVAMGGFSGTPDSGFTSSSMVIDYVRVYQNNALSNAEFNANSFKLYPNPTKDIVYIDSNMPINSVQIFDTLGNIVMDKKNTNNKFNVSNLSNGLYLLRINSNNRTLVKKLIIQY